MLTATLQKSKGFESDHIYQVSASGSPIATLNETKFTFNYSGTNYTIFRKGFLSPDYQLKCDDADVVTLSQASFLNRYTMVLDDKEWVLKPRGFSEKKFGLFLDDIERGAVSDVGYKGIVADFPDEVPIRIQLFLLLVLIWKWAG